MRQLPFLLTLLVGTTSAHAQVCQSDWLRPQIASSIGDDKLAPAMAKLLGAFRVRHPEWAPPNAWRHDSDVSAIAALMFEQADLAPLSRASTAAELAPYDHQFRGDMMKRPDEYPIGKFDGRTVNLAVNRRPDAPLPERTRLLITFALSAEGQAAMSSQRGFEPLDSAARTSALARLGSPFVPSLDPHLGTYFPAAGVRGAIRSVGSDGLKSLMDGWFCRFASLQPGVTKGSRWEHFGTLNGFEALLAGGAEIAPMGRELWPDELAAWRKVFGEGSEPVEIRVARGGFNTQQRTTAQAVFVHPSNPLASLSTNQLAAIFGASPSITTWGELGLGGAWADRPIHVLIPPKAAPNTMSFQIGVLKGRPWADTAQAGTVPETARDLQADPAAIGFGGLEDGTPGLKTLAIAPAAGAAAVPLDAESASSGRYPLTRYMYVRLAPGKPSAATIGFLRYVLSREAQERVRYSGYFPLNAAAAREELAKLDKLAR